MNLIVALVVWNILLTILVGWLLMKDSVWYFQWPYVEIDKSGVWFGWKSESGSQATRIIKFPGNKED